MECKIAGEEAAAVAKLGLSPFAAPSLDRPYRCKQFVTEKSLKAVDLMAKIHSAPLTSKAVSPYYICNLVLQGGDQSRTELSKAKT